MPDAPAADPRQRIKEMGRRIEALRRRVLDPDILRGLLPLRVPMAVRRSAAAPARDREAGFRVNSPAYAAALGDDAAFAGQTRTITLDGLTWWVPLLRPDDPAHVQRYLGHQDFPYRAITQTRDVAVGGVMLDIGANIGRMSIPRVILGDVTMAYGAEPDPLNYACFVRNVRDNGLTGLVMPDQVAIGAADGTVRLRRGRTAGGHRLATPGTQPSRKKSIDVRCLTLDSWVDRIGVDVGQLVFVKVDAQGSEVDVLRGAARVLTCRHVAWQIEIDIKLLANRGFTGDELFALIRKHFTHFIDLGREPAGQGRRFRPAAEIADALGYLARLDRRTDVLAFTLDESGLAETA